ncbi:MAG: hypothetical protein JRN15_12550 [Nitrososphaerota archaeon]|nr:hypothetical protein [Nitrososphaerota archaeon]
MVEEIRDNGEILAIIVRSGFCEDGVKFFTPSFFSQQLAFMKHPRGHEIGAHVHIEAQRDVLYTKEVLVMRKGKLRVDFYREDQSYLESRILSAGDVILLARGGHGFRVIEDVEMFEIKQGPYLGEKDKRRFSGVIEKLVKVKGLL